MSKFFIWILATRKRNIISLESRQYTNPQFWETSNNFLVHLPQWTRSWLTSFKGRSVKFLDSSWSTLEQINHNCVWKKLLLLAGVFLVPARKKNLDATVNFFSSKEHPGIGKIMLSCLSLVSTCLIWSFKGMICFHLIHVSNLNRAYV